MMKKIYVDGYFLSQKITGVQRYAKQFIENMIDNGYEVTLIAPSNATLDIPGAKKIQSRFKGMFWQQCILPFILLAHGFPPLLSLTGIGPVFYPNKILAIHDASIYRFPQFFSKTYLLFYRIVYPVSIFFSKALITVSNFSMTELRHFIRMKKKIYVIYNVTSDLVSTDGDKISLLDGVDKYILTVGSLDERKNLKRVVKAFNNSSIKEEYKLIVAGGNSSAFSDIKLECENKNVIFTGYVTDGQLINLYKNASFFVYLSIYEGFGIPPLEALTCDCPVLLADIDVFREVYGDEFKYVNPSDISKISHEMEKFSRLDREKIKQQQHPVISKFSKQNQIVQIHTALSGAFGEKNITVQ